MFKIFRNTGRFTLLANFVLWLLIVSLLLRFTFFIWEHNEVSWNIANLLRTLITGLFFDIGAAAFICLLPALYFVLIPNKWVGSFVDKVIIWVFTALNVFIFTFSFFAEITFWEEFSRRFNFIAVDYLIYTHEVIANINESYPLPFLISGIVLITALILFIFYKRKAFNITFKSTATTKQRIGVIITIVITALLYGFSINNTSAEWSANRYNSEISKNGIYSFFAAFRNNQMKYNDFYTSIDQEKALQIVENKLKSSNSVFTDKSKSIHRTIIDTLDSSSKKNLVFIMVESLSGSFMKEFGNEENLTPFLDSLAQKSIFFENLYATGTRTVRGMEAVTLCIPPTPGRSIVKRPENTNLYTIRNVFGDKGYDCNFFYGGDGYFDNMNAYFGGNGFSIYDRGRGSVLSDKIQTVRHNITDDEVTFENAWGICDEDIFNKMLSVADEQYKNNKPFFNYIMTTSNHRPYTYPEGKVDIPSGTGRAGAVKYTDYALRELFKKASTKPWFKNTVFVIVADHCASSAGKDAIDVANYHIPAFIVNFEGEPNRKIEQQCSQIDLFPTLFSLFHWSYESDFFGKDVLCKDFEERSLLGTYRKLVLMKQDEVMILSDQKGQDFYQWQKDKNELTLKPMDKSFLDETISWYETADYLYNNKLLQ
ncbi:sulfatase-like hydrolase/transferase [Flavobacterium sp. ST-75]|uniref:Sulfatase-like hydrolase/transferase n=1 Tax=Flavobacterium rhizophilum TaxID=3163296 RepID=A0ABW8YA27_9FLAO